MSVREVCNVTNAYLLSALDEKARGAMLAKIDGAAQAYERWWRMRHVPGTPWTMQTRVELDPARPTQRQYQDVRGVLAMFDGVAALG